MTVNCRSDDWNVFISHNQKLLQQAAVFRYFFIFLWGPTVYILDASSPPFTWSQQTWQLVLSPQRFTSETTACLLTHETNEHMIATAEQELCHQCNLWSSETLSVSDALPSVPFVTHTEESCVSVSLESARTAIVSALNCFWNTKCSKFYLGSVRCAETTTV